MTEVVDLGYKPRPWQAAVHRALKRFSVLVVHRRGGKTVLAIMHLIDRALRGKPGRDDCRFAYIAPFMGQAKAVAWGYLTRYSEKVPGCKINNVELWVEFPNGSRVRIYGADNPDALRGIYLDGVVPDEVAQMKPATWHEIIRPALSDKNGWALIIGTPHGMNLFSELYFAAKNDPTWYCGMYTVYDTDALPSAEIELIRSEQHPNVFAREFLCDFSAETENNLLSFLEVDAACNRHYTEDHYGHSPKILGVDVARQGDDSTVIFRRQGLVSFNPTVLNKMDAMQVADHVAVEINEWNPDAIFVDGSGGYGAGVIDRLRTLRYKVVEVQFGSSPSDARYENRRAEMWFKMAEWIKGGGLIPNLQRLKADLCGPTYSHNKKDKLQLESKDDMKARGLPSPDCFIAGTLVDTPRGPTPIERLLPGDIVCTPMGDTRIHAVMESRTDSLTTASFSNRSVLVGTGKHKVFVWGRGAVRLDTLALTDSMEPNTKPRRLLWALLSMFTTRARDSEFRRLVDIIILTTSVRPSAFCIAVCGQTCMALYRTARSFITRTITGAIMPLITWSYASADPTCPSTCMSASPIQSTWPRTINTLRRPETLPVHGTGLLRDWLGTPRMVRRRGPIELRSAKVVKCAAVNTRLTSTLEAITALAHALSQLALGVTSLIRERVRTAVNRLWRTATAKLRVVPCSVATEPVGCVSVYNLTLEKHNAYYANGILVFNCADALCLTWAYPVRPAADREREALVGTQSLKPFDALARAKRYGR